MGSFSIWHWLIVLVVVVLLFGSKKLRNLGGDLGAAIKGFKTGIKEDSGSDSAAASVISQSDTAQDLQNNQATSSSAQLNEAQTAGGVEVATSQSQSQESQKVQSTPKASSES